MQLTATRRIAALRSMLEHDLGPAPRPTDAQIGLIIRFVRQQIPELTANRRQANRVNSAKEFSTRK